MANTWLRLYHDMPNDPKWRTIARAAKQTIPVVLAVYVHLLTIASGAVERGTVVNVNSEDLASALDIDSDAVDAVLVAMQGRVLDGEKLSGWDKRQTNREDGAAERAKAWREAKKREKEELRTQTNAANGSRTQTNDDERKRTPDKKREEEIRQEESTKTLASTAIAVPAARGKLVCTLPLNTGDHEVFEADVQEWIPLYPAVDIRQELRTMKGWLLGSPQRRKTKTGVGKFINAWFARAQNESRPGAGNGTTQGNHKPNAAVDRQRITHDAIRDAALRRYGPPVGNDDGRGPGIQAEPDLASGDAGCVPPGVGGDCPEVRFDDFQGRTLEGTP